MLKKSFKIYVAGDREKMGKTAAGKVGKKIVKLQRKKDYISMVFGAAPSQNEMLKNLLAYPGIEWSRIHAFHMDEYTGLSKGAPESFASYLDQNIFLKVNFKSINYLNGTAADLNAECERYSALLRKHPVDIVCLGIGENGHIAFNDPPVADFNDPKLVKVVELDHACRQQQVNDGCFPAFDDVPTHALTLTIPALLSGKSLFCTVPSVRKAQAVRDTLIGQVTEQCPASILRLHNSVRLFLDKESASLL